MAPPHDNFANSETSAAMLPTPTTTAARPETPDTADHGHGGVWQGIASTNHLTPPVSGGMAIIGHSSKALSALSSSTITQVNAQTTSDSSFHNHATLVRDVMITANSHESHVSTSNDNYHIVYANLLHNTRIPYLPKNLRKCDPAPLIRQGRMIIHLSGNLLC